MRAASLLVLLSGLPVPAAAQPVLPPSAPLAAAVAGGSDASTSEDVARQRFARTATTMSLVATFAPVTAAAVMAKVDQEAAAGTLLFSGLLVGPATGLIYGRCYLHAATGTALRVVGVLTTFSGIGLAIDGYGPVADHAAVLVWGGTALFVGSSIYDLLSVSKCSRRNFMLAQPRPLVLQPSIVGGAPGAALSLRF